MSFVLAYNPTDSPVIIDIAGRALGGGEWGAVDPVDVHTAAAVDGSRIVLAAAPGKDAGPAAVAAQQEAQRLTKRQSTFAATDPVVLLDLALTAGLFTDDAKPTVDQLVLALTRSSVDLPVAATPSKE
jgi:hypothetical protein